MTNIGIKPFMAANYPFLANKAHWKHDKLQYLGDAWFGQAVARPDYVLEDLKIVFSGAPAPAGTSVKYFRNVADGELQAISPDTCTTVTCDSYLAQAPLLAEDDTAVPASAVRNGAASLCAVLAAAVLALAV